MVSEKGYKLDPSSIKPALSLKKSSPKTVNEVRKLMGFLNYYRQYIKYFSKMAKPIYDLIKITDNPSEESTREKPRQGKRNRYHRSTQLSGPALTNPHQINLLIV